jgi:small-conductance mechanosensitive channel
VGAKAYGITVFADILASIFPALKRALPFQVDSLFEVAPQIGFLFWSIKSFSTIKNLLLNKLVYGTRLGKVAFMDRLIDLGLGIGAGYNVLAILKYEMGVSLRGFFAASGVSAIVISLAVKGMVEQMVGGLLLQAWDAVEVGEVVRLGDGTEGTVVRIGLVETEILGADHVPVRVPNSQIVGKRVHMYSRVNKSKVKQTLRFKYSDMEKMPKILQDIKQEIMSNCSEKMLGEPSVLLANYEDDHIQVTVSCSFDFPPGSREYDETKQSALFAISNSMKKNKVEFALPAIQYETNGRPLYQ